MFNPINSANFTFIPNFETSGSTTHFRLLNLDSSLCSSFVNIFVNIISPLVIFVVFNKLLGKHYGHCAAQLERVNRQHNTA